MPSHRARGSITALTIVLAAATSPFALAQHIGTARYSRPSSAVEAPQGACGPENFTQNASQTPEAGAAVTCLVNDNSMHHLDTSWWRAFRLTDYGIQGDFGICELDVAIELADDGPPGGAGQPMTVNVWQNSDECPFPGGTRTLLGTATVTIQDQSLTNISIPVFATVPALSEFAVELAIPDGSAAGDIFFTGSNTAAQTKPTFWSSNGCSVPTPVDLASLGFPDSHVIMTVVGVESPFGAAGIAVDPTGNQVVELGEPAAIEPSYKNLTGADLTILGSLVNIYIPPPFTSGIVDGTADYGTIPAGGTASCASTANCYQVQFDGVGYGHRDGTIGETLLLATAQQTPAGGGARTRTVHIGGSFADVPTSNLFYSFIETLLHNGVTGGCATTDSYCPGNTTLRKQMAVFLLKAFNSACYVPPPAAGIFSDVPIDDLFAPWVEDLSNRGITGGCGPGLYCPDGPVKRKQMAVFLLKTLEGSGYVPPPAVGIFDDVPDDAFRPFIEDLYNRGITGGCAGGPPPAPISFCPENSVTRGQMAAFLTKTFSLLLYRP